MPYKRMAKLRHHTFIPVAGDSQHGMSELSLSDGIVSGAGLLPEIL